MKRKRKFGVRLDHASHKSWLPGQKGQGGEGLSKGYGGSAGRGDGVSGPQTATPVAHEHGDDDRDTGKKSDERYSPSLPSRSWIARILR